MSLLDVLILLIAAGLLAAVMQLHGITSRLDRLTHHIGRRQSDCVHDATHPVFSVAQLHRARQRFEDAYKNHLRQETDLYNSGEWQDRKKRADAVSAHLQEQMRAVCEALVESECAWKEYDWMIEGNLSVVRGLASRKETRSGFRDLMTRTRGTAVAMTVAPNSTKVRRVDEILSNWTARVRGAASEALAVDVPDRDEEIFDVPPEERQQSLAR